MAKKFTKEGKELPDQERVELPIGYRIPETMEEKMMRIIDGKMSQRAAEQGLETIEEANDFDVGDEDGLPLPMSQFELTDMQEENFARDASFRKEKARGQRDKAPSGRAQDRSTGSGEGGKPDVPGAGEARGGGKEGGKA